MKTVRFVLLALVAPVAAAAADEVATTETVHRLLVPPGHYVVVEDGLAWTSATPPPLPCDPAVPAGCVPPTPANCVVSGQANGWASRAARVNVASSNGCPHEVVPGALRSVTFFTAGGGKGRADAYNYSPFGRWDVECTTAGVDVEGRSTVTCVLRQSGVQLSQYTGWDGVVYGMHAAGGVTGAIYS